MRNHLFEKNPEAAAWLVNLLEHARPPTQLATTVQAQKILLLEYIHGSQLFTPAEQLLGFLAHNMNQAQAKCATCGQDALVDITKVSCPKCKGPMTMRTNRATGNQFMGCTAWPNCRGTKALSDVLLETAAELQRQNAIVAEGSRRIEL